MYNYGMLLQSVGAASVILGTIGMLLQGERIPIVLLFGGGLALFVGWAMQ